MSHDQPSTDSPATPSATVSRGRRLAVIVALVALTGLSLALIWDGAQTYGVDADSTPRMREATGRIESFGPDRRFANIAHDRIEGFMEAMTMPFDFAHASQAAALREGQRVRFTFRASREGRLVIETIAPSP